MKKILLASTVYLLLSFGATAFADEIQSGVDAFNKGDYEHAIAIFRSFVDQGNPRAENNLGVMYKTGKGLEKNYSEAAKLFRLSAEQDCKPGQVNLGLVYQNGEGVTQDFVRAYMWFNLAGISGNQDAIKNRDQIADKMTPTQIAEAQKLAHDCQARKFKGCD